MQNNQLFIKNTHKTLLLFVLLTCFFIIKMDAQNWPWISPVAGAGNQTITSITIQPGTGNILTAGHFRNELSIGDNTTSSDGATDLFLIANSPDGVPLWSQTGHSPGADLSSDVAADNEGNIFWAGTFWFTTDFEGISLSAAKSNKALFLLKLDADGNLIWGKSIEGTDNKILSAMTADPAGNTYLTGNFSDSLFVDSRVLTATAEKDFFIAKFAPDGTVIWVEQAGISGEIIPARMVYDEDRIAVTGSMRGQYDFGTDTIKNNTNDSDGFLVVYNSDGEVGWGRKIGGVNEQDGSDTGFDEAGNVYAAGSFFGLVRLGQGLEIQTQNLNENLYIIKYDPTGHPLMARSIGGLDLELSQSLDIVDNRMYWCGYFRDEFEVDGFTLTAGETDFSSFVLELNTDAFVLAAHSVNSEATVLLTHLTALSDGTVYLGGSLNGTASFAGTTLTASDGYDSFVGKLNATLTSVENTIARKVRIFPNPAKDMIRINEADIVSVQVYSAAGNLILETPQKEINCSAWVSGVYYFLIKTKAGSVVINKVVKQP